MKLRPWLIYALLTTLLWGVWGAYIELPEKNGFPATLIYCIWAATMIVPAIYVLYRVNWKLQYDKKSIFYGSLIGILGAGGQLAVCYAVTIGPTYLIFPIISVSPVITVVLSFLFLKERTGVKGLLGIILAIISLPLLAYSTGSTTGNYDTLWFVWAVLILLAWGIQAYFMKFANKTMSAESIFFYMMLTGLLIVPVALLMTDFTQEINWGPDGPWLAAAIQILNALGALFLVYAFRYGKAIVVSPLTNAGAPLITAIMAMILVGVVPGTLKIIGILLAIVAALLLAIEPEEESPENQQESQ